MSINTLFDIESKHYKVIDGKIVEFTVKSISISVNLSKTVKVDYYGVTDTGSETLSEFVLKDHWFRNPEEAVNYLLVSFYKLKEKYENGN